MKQQSVYGPETEVVLYLRKVRKECLACATSQSIPIASGDKVVSFCFKNLQKFQEAQSFENQRTIKQLLTDFNIFSNGSSKAWLDSFPSTLRNFYPVTQYFVNQRNTSILQLFAYCSYLAVPKVLPDSTFPNKIEKIFIKSTCENVL